MCWGGSRGWWEGESRSAPPAAPQSKITFPLAGWGVSCKQGFHLHQFLIQARGPRLSLASEGSLGGCLGLFSLQLMAASRGQFAVGNWCGANYTPTHPGYK